MKTLGINIRKKREELGMTQQELADKLGYASKSTINKIENGTNDITQSKIIAFAKALNTTVPELMGWEDNVVSKSSNPYYLNDDVRELAQELFERHELRILFDATKKVKPEDIKFVQELVERLKQQE